VLTFIGVPPDSIGRRGLGGMGSRVGRGEQSIERRVDRGKAEHMRAVVVNQSMD